MTAAPQPPDALGEQVMAVVTESARVVAQRAGEPINEGGLANPEAIRQVLTLLARSAGLRRLVRGALDGRLDDPTARALVAPDVEVSGAAVREVQGTLTGSRRARRRDERRTRTATVTERNLAREAAKVSRLREARDQARAQARSAGLEATALRRQVADLTAVVGELTDRSDALATRIAAEQAVRRDVPGLARALATALDRRRNLPTPQSRPGEPAWVDPTRPSRPPTGPDPDLTLVDAARLAGLPEAVSEHAARWLPALLRALADPPPVRVGPDLTPRVEVLGGGAEIGGSCVLVTAGRTRILVDAGTRPQGRDAHTLAPPGIERALAGRLDAIVVTHAHADHAGWVPVLVAEQPHTPVLTSAATADLLSTMWMDAAKVLGRRGQDTGTSAPYTRAEVTMALGRIETLTTGTRRRVGDLAVELFPAGHVLGAVGVVVHAGDRRVVVSGDVSGPGQATVGGIVVPDSAVGADLLVLESTYAGMRRPVPRPQAVEGFVRDVATVLDRGGRVLVPAFALGRAQEIALLCAEHLPDAEVLVDGLARAVSTVYEGHEGPDGQNIQIFRGRVRRVPPGGTQAELARPRAGIVITTSGMLTAGPAVAWARAILPDPRGGVMIVGYQDDESPGRRLLALAESGGGVFQLPATDQFAAEPVTVAAHVAAYRLGAHASADELVGITSRVGAGEVMLVHGEPSGQNDLRARLSLRRQQTIDALEWTASTR